MSDEDERSLRGAARLMAMVRRAPTAEQLLLEEFWDRARGLDGWEREAEIRTFVADLLDLFIERHPELGHDVVCEEFARQAKASEAFRTVIAQLRAGRAEA